MVVKLSAMHFPSLAVASLIALSFMGIEETVAKNQIVPPYEWTSTPAWSADGRFVAVTWPAPPIVAADGTLTRVIGKSEKDSNMSVWPTQPTISATAKAPVGIRTNFDERKTLFLNASTYERLPISIPDELRDASWSPDGKMIAGYDCRLSKGSIFEAANGKVILIIPDDKPGFMSGFIWSPDSKRIAVAQGDGVHVWDVPGKKQAYSLPNLAGPCRSISWSPNGKAIAALGATYRESPTTAIRLCAADTGRSLFSVNSQSGVGSAAWSSNGTYFAYSDKSVHILRSDSMD